MQKETKRDKAKFLFDPGDRKLILAHIGFSFFAIFAGAIAGLLQGLQRTGFIELPASIGYYQLLTVHGVMMALIFTTFFIIGYLYSGVARTLGGSLPSGARTTAWTGYYLMVAGTVLATIEILTNDASVLYTFYAPLQADPLFYIGMALVVVGSWLSGFAIFAAYAKWRRANKGQPSPLFAYMAVATMVLWQICTIGVAIEVVFQLIPWSLGWIDKINVELSRTLFWYFGHPLVYFWLLPAYIFWYVNVPKIVGGKIFSDSLPRLTFVLFILYSIPVGFHHQLMEPGISSFWKFLQVVLTMIVVIPSLMTAFSMMATFELAGREKGATGLFGFFRKLPFRDARFFAAFAGMVIFIPAGAGGVINASYQLDQVVHNTLWITGHFHLTVASTVALTFFAITYSLFPALTGRRITPFINKLGIWHTIIWVLGMAFMSIPMHIVGLFGEPRRTAYTTYMDHPVVQTWEPYRKLIGIGSGLLFIGVLLFLFIALYMWFAAPRTEQLDEFPIGEVHDTGHRPPPILERWGVWIALTLILTLIAYTVPVMHIINHAPESAGVRSW
ncbi:b(o/a)3-type cytochrome-c oxidase subunit 1 [Paenibacillus soyae]|uniref:B(O/a)3-type cytochrome-c oxidase subunit 1 n=1 Tax=Paenibacillus soyae TaxID=2969249 RepID=A0A9X2S9Z3_9BACL|nr:b(o/a)3-type cytochrome-c oxidase subunit 1 [Paenibacillus soyae]MCR2804068.1 b(o/a)3-type cytochrome-c oxidase subunit 1 [Paenibacillus soyae]